MSYTMEEVVRLKLLNDSAVSDYLGQRIYPTAAQHDTTTPFMTYQLISRPEETDIEGRPYLPKYRIQLNFLSDDWKEARAVLMEVRRVVLDPAFRGTWFDDVTIDSVSISDIEDMGIDEDTEFKWHRMDVEIFEQL